MPDLAQQPYIVARMVDASDSRGEMRVHVQRTATRAAGVAAAAQLASVMDAASSCVAVEWLLRYPVLIVREGSGASGSDHHRQGLLVFRTTDPTQFGLVEIPGIRADLVDDVDPTQLDRTAPALSAYIDALIAGSFCNPFGYQLTECIAALYQLRQK